jgi:methyl-accepting chemotaxis protein
LAVAVDDGKIEVDTEIGKVDLESGKMTQVEYDGRAGPPEKAVPREKRDWKAWRKDKVERLINNLPTAAPKFQRRFENAVQRAERFTGRVNQKAEEIRNLADELRRAKAEKDRKRVLQSRQSIQKDIQSFKDMAKKFRKAMNQVRAMGQLSRRVEDLFEKNRGKYSDQDIAVIQSSLMVIAEKRAQLKDIFRSTVFNIKRTFRELRAFSAG